MGVLCLAAALQAQPASPRLGYVYPAGGQQGTAIEVVVGGQNLSGVSSVLVTGGGADMKVVQYNRPLSQAEFMRLRDRLQELQDKRQAARQSSTNTWAASDEAEVAEIRQKILKNPPNRQGNPAIAETVTLAIALSTNAEPTARELRLAGPGGVSNPLAFRVSVLPETTAPPARSPNPDLDRFLSRLGQKPPTPPAESQVEIPVVVNGQIMPGEVDRHRFSARRGQRLLLQVEARSLIPYLADAVPGWFQAILTLRDAQGREVAYNDDFGFRPDPVICCEVPRDGEYTVEIKDSIYRGREDFVYRLTIGELPFVTSVFPLGGRAGEATRVELDGWNLPGTNRVIRVQLEATGLHKLEGEAGEHPSPILLFATDSLPERQELEPNNSPATAESTAMPVILNGRIGQPGDEDVFRFEGRAGDEIVAEVLARRLGSPVDSFLRLTDAAGQVVAFNDDHEDKGAGLHTHHADSWLLARLPVDGAYLVQVGDVQNHGGAEFAYRLRLSSPRPDYELRVFPSSVNLRGGLAQPLTVFALRKDGFAGEIKLALQDAPAGWVLGGGTIPAGQDQVRITLAAPGNAPKEPTRLHFEGRAVIRNETVTRAAVPAEDMMQAFLYRHLVPAQDFFATVANRGSARSPVRFADARLARIPAGGTTRVRLGVPGGPGAGRFDLELNEPPEGITLEEISRGRDGLELVLRSDGLKAKPGLAGNLIVNVLSAQPVGSATNARPIRPNRRFPLGTLPALPFEVVAPR